MPTGVFEHKRRSPIDRFEEKFIPEPNSGCWLWTARVNQDGYGQFRLERYEGARRIAWILYRGPVPSGLSVLHKCDVRCCVNPDHLYLGTQKHNMKDAKDRQRLEFHRDPQKVKDRLDRVRAASVEASSPLTWEIVRKIRQSPDNSHTLAAQHGVTWTTIERIRKNLRWKEPKSAHSLV